MRRKKKNKIGLFMLSVGISVCFLISCKNRENKENINQQSGNPAILQTDQATKTPEPTPFLTPTIHEEEEIESSIPVSFIISQGKTIKERFALPTGFIRVVPEENSFAEYLQNLPLKPDGTKVRYFDGREKTKQVYLGVVDFTLGERDLQQCADAVMRLRAEYLYEKERYDEIQFHFVSGFKADFSTWSSGNGISVKDNQVSWYSNSNHNSSYESFQKYLDIVYAYSSTLSLEKELADKDISELEIGDVFIQGGSPGHCVIVVDAAIHEETGEKIFILAQSYMPAQDIQILIGNEEDSPWFTDKVEEFLSTPEWRFYTTDLKTWKEE